MVTTSDETYWKPLRCSIDINSGSYTYNAFTDNVAGKVNKLMYCRLELPVTGFGVAQLQIEDNDRTLNRNTVRSGNEVDISVGKSSAGLTKVFNGIIREQGDSLADDNSDLYNLTAYGTGIRFNERVVHVDISAATLDDGVTLDPNDTNMQANKIVKDIIDDNLYYPLDSSNANFWQEEGYNYITAANLLTDSSVNDYIARISQKHVLMSSVFNNIEELTNANIFVDENGDIQLQRDLDLLSGRRGFLITNNPNTSNDDVDNTIYFKNMWNTSVSFTKEKGYSNRFYGILPYSLPDMTGISNYTASTNLFTTWVAQKFKPPTSYMAGIHVIVTASSDSITPIPPAGVGRFGGIVADNNGVPGTSYLSYYTLHWPESVPGDTDTSAVFAWTGNKNQLTGLSLDIEKYYWLILERNTTSYTSTNRLNWAYRATGTATSATNTAAASPGTPPASGWTVNTNSNLYGFFIPRIATSYVITDQKSLSRYDPIESTLSSLPLMVDDKHTMRKHMINICSNAVSPQISYQMSEVIPPNKPIFPGDPCMIVDTKTNLSTTNNRAICAIIGSVAYEFGRPGAGQGSEAMGQFYMSINPIGSSTFY